MYICVSLTLGIFKKFEFKLQLELKMASKSKSETRFPCTLGGGLHAKSGLRFSIRYDIHRENHVRKIRIYRTYLGGTRRWKVPTVLEVLWALKVGGTRVLGPAES